MKKLFLFLALIAAVPTLHAKPGPILQARLDEAAEIGLWIVGAMYLALFAMIGYNIAVKIRRERHIPYRIF